MYRKQHLDAAGMKGWVRGVWVNKETGEKRVAFERRNQLSFACCDVLAGLMAGNASRAPQYIGFIYGTNASPNLVAPTVRAQTWEALKSELAAVASANIQVAPLSLTPQTTKDNGGPAGAEYNGNAVIFNAHTQTGSAGQYGFPTTEPFAGVMNAGVYLYHAVLLTPTGNPQNPYLIVARLSLIDGAAYDTKPNGFELALEWQVSFY